MAPTGMTGTQRDYVSSLSTALGGVVLQHKHALIRKGSRVGREHVLISRVTRVYGNKPYACMRGCDQVKFCACTMLYKHLGIHAIASIASVIQCHTYEGWKV